jgi:hypothetical protein
VRIATDTDSILDSKEENTTPTTQVADASVNVRDRQVVPTLSNLIPLFIEDGRIEGWTVKSRARYRRECERFSEFMGPNTLAADVTVDDVKAWLACFPGATTRSL